MTTEVVMTANIDADADDSTTPVSSMSLDGLTETIDEVAGGRLLNLDINIRSLGAKHDLTIVFEKTATSTWDYYVLTDGEMADPSGIGYADGYAFATTLGSDVQYRWGTCWLRRTILLWSWNYGA